MADRPKLLAAKLRVLVRERWGTAAREPRSFAAGAALVEGDTAWVLLDHQPIRSFGAALIWAARAGARELHVLTEIDPGVVARRAALFADPPAVWAVDGLALREARPDAPAVQTSPDAPSDLALLLLDAGLEVVVEGGVLRGERLGLEVARVVHGETTAGTPLDEPALEVGVGKADRELTAMLHGTLPPVAQLERVIEIVDQHRAAGAEPHPLNRLVPERWLRAVVVRRPELVGVDHLTFAEPAVPRANLTEPGIAVAVGERGDQRVVVGFSVGIDVDAVPAAADARASIDPEAELLIVVPARDDHPAIRDLAARLCRPAVVVAVDDGWRGALPVA